MLAILVLLGACALVGLWVLGSRFTGHETGWLIGGTLAATIVVTGLRFQIAVGGSEYEALTSDTFRYLLYGRQRWLADEAILSGLAARDGTAGTITLSQIAFFLFGDHWFAVFLAGSLAGLVGTWLIAATIKILLPTSGVILAFVVSLFPSVLYWSSSFGKEAFSLLGVGLAAHALARRSTGAHSRQPFVGAGGLAAGIGVAWIVRPEVAFLIAGAAIAGWAAVRPGPRPGIRRAVMTVGVIGVPAVVVVATATGYSDPLGLIDDLTTRHERTSLGGSQIGLSRPTGLAGLVVGIPTAILRPFPWEAGLGGLGSSLDTILIVMAAATMWGARRRLSHLDLPRMRLLVFSLTIILVLFGPLAGYGNLGLLARMRSLTIPALLVALAIARSTRPVNEQRRSVTEQRVDAPLKAGRSRMGGTATIEPYPSALGRPQRHGRELWKDARR